MDYREEIKEKIANASKPLRAKIKKIIDLNAELTGIESREKIKAITDTLSKKDYRTYDCFVAALNAISVRRATMHLAVAQMKEAQLNIIKTLTIVRDFDEKVNLLNYIADLDLNTSMKLYDTITKEDGICTIEKEDNGKFTLKVKNLKKVIKKEVDIFNENRTDGKTLIVCLDAFAEEYGITDFISSDIQEAIDGIKMDFSINAELFKYYNKYTSIEGRFGNMSARLSSDFLLLDEDEEAPKPKEESLLLTYEDAKPIEGYLSYGLFKL